NGGKGIATSSGTMLVLYPLYAAAGLVFFVTLRLTGSKLKWKEAGAIASISTWFFFALLILIFASGREALYAGLMAVFLAWRHKKNFQNLFGAKPASLASPQ
ncbi:MAG TPA: glycerol-3-phosphate acyltransferase, partial [Terriglobia bacterium]|nr:glycerol-3-phosphate acyltransferase [Terriglobia bacterium]